MPIRELPQELKQSGLTGLHRTIAFSETKSSPPRWHAIDDLEAWSTFPFARLQPKHSFNLFFADLDVNYDASQNAIIDLHRVGIPPSFTTAQSANSGQASWCLNRPVHLTSRKRTSKVLFGPIIYYKHISRLLQKTVHGSKHGHGRSRQRNPLFTKNNGRILNHPGYSLHEIASAIGVNKQKILSETEQIVDITSRQASRTTQFGPRSTAPYDTRFEAAANEARYIYANRHEFIALRAMRGHYHLAHDIGPNSQTLTATIKSLNECLPTPFMPNEAGGVECIVQGIIDSFASGKIFGMNLSTRTHTAMIKGGRSSAKKSKAKVKDRNALVFAEHAKGSTATQINDALKSAGFKTISGAMISHIIKQQKPLTMTRAQRDNSIIEQWMRCRNLTDIARRHQICRQTVTRVILRHIDKTANAGVLLYLPKNVKMTTSIRQRIKDSKVAHLTT